METQTMTDKELKKPAVVNTQEKTRGEPQFVCKPIHIKTVDD